MPDDEQNGTLSREVQTSPRAGGGRGLGGAPPSLPDAPPPVGSPANLGRQTETGPHGALWGWTSWGASLSPSFSIWGRRLIAASSQVAVRLEVAWGVPQRTQKRASAEAAGG